MSMILISMRMIMSFELRLVIGNVMLFNPSIIIIIIIIVGERTELKVQY